MPDVAIQGVISGASSVSGQISRKRAIATSVSSVSAIAGAVNLVGSITLTISGVMTGTATSGIITPFTITLSALATVLAEAYAINYGTITLSAIGSVPTAESSLVRNAAKSSSIVGTLAISINTDYNPGEQSLSGLGFMRVLTTSITDVSISLSGVASLIKETVSTAIANPTRNISAKLKIYFDGIDQTPVTIEKDGICYLNILEEAKADSNSPLGCVSANSLDISLYNTNGTFTPTNADGPYYGKLVPHVPIKAYIVIKDEETSEIEMGTFYSGDWEALASKIEASTKAVDKLYALSQIEMPTVKAQANTTVRNMFVLLFDLLGITSAEYNIGASLDIPIGIAWLPEGTVGQALQWLAEAGLCIVYMDRANIIQVKRIEFSGVPQHTLTDSDQLLDSNIPTRYEQVYSKLVMNNHIPSLGVSEAILEIPDMIIPVGTTLITKASFQKGPVGLVDYASITGTVAATIKIVGSTSWNIDLEITNTGSEEPGTITVYGKPINITAIPTVYEDAALKAIIGEKTFTVQNKLIQDTAYATLYAGYLFSLIANPNNYVKLAIRGNPQIEIGSIVTMLDNTSPVETVDLVVMRSIISLAGGMDSILEGMVLNEL